MSDGDSCGLSYYEGDQDTLGKIRKLWDEIFDDRDEFADFYFEQVCAENRILMAKIKDELVGMIHLNPYNVLLDGKKCRCYYIVGVAVKPEYRRQGIMRNMLSRVIEDMKVEGCPFTFLMPEREEYYESFGFEKIYNTLELDIDISMLEDEDVVPDDLSGEEGFYWKKLTDMFEEERYSLAVLATEINEALEKRYEVFSYRTATYLHHMRAEHICQNGGVVAVYEDGMRLEDGQVEERLAGLFSYDVYDDTMYVERFESYDENVRYVLDAALRVAEAAYCSRLVVTMAEKHFCDDIANMLGIAARMNDGNGIMALPLVEDADAMMQKLKNVSFFDEIV